MAEVKPLTLKAERAQRVRPALHESQYCEILVDLPFSHAEEVFTYTLTQGCEDAQVGDLVSVPFGRSIVEGVILSRSESTPVTGTIKPIHSLISHHPVLSIAQIDLARSVAKRYASDSWSVIRSAFPPFSITGERAALKQMAKSEGVVCRNSGEKTKAEATWLPKSLDDRIRGTDRLRDLLLLSPSQDPYRTLCELARIRSEFGKVVVVLPDHKDLHSCARTLEDFGITFITISSEQSKSARYASYLQAHSMKSGIVLTLRHGTLMDLSAGDTLIIYNEVESHHYERRSPSWNSRDIGLLRSKESSVLFVSHSPSVELVKQVESRWVIAHSQPRERVKGLFFQTADGLEPDLFSKIRSSLAKGNVLISVSHSGYIAGFSCGQCRTPAACTCGGRLRIGEKSAAPECSVCATVYLGWRCPWCQSEKKWATKRGAIRTAAEFGRAFPQSRVVASSGSSQISELPPGSSIVVATLGAEPSAEFAGIFIMDAMAAYSKVELRGQEEVRSQWFKLLSFLRRDGSFYLSLPASESISQAMIRADAYDLALREMHERAQAELPPHKRILICEGPYADLSALGEVLESRGSMIFPLARSRSGAGRLMVKFDPSMGEEIADLMAGVQRIRAAQKRELLSLRFDPYSIQE